VSLTVAELNANQLRVSLIPHTQTATNLQYRLPGQRINVEFDQNLKLAATRGQKSSIDLSTEWGRSMADEAFMDEAIQLGQRGRYTTSPNPWVGSVIVKDGLVIGRGYGDSSLHHTLQNFG